MRIPKETLVGLDGLEPEAPPPDFDGLEPGATPHSLSQTPTKPTPTPLRLSAESSARLRTEIERAGGREVCFLARVDEERVVCEPRAVARGNFSAVLVAARDADEGGVMLHNHPSGVLEPSDADMRVAAQLYEEGLGTAIIDNDARQLYVIVEPPRLRVRVPLRPEELDEILGPGGGLAQRFDGYEDRPGQRDMLRTVVDRFNNGGVAIVEAGTGTGKSLAYLLPAARWAQENGERTVVSTNTINLQEQLAGKDLPLVQSLTGDIRWALVKGRGNYISIRRARLAADSAPLLFEDDRVVSQHLRVTVQLSSGRFLNQRRQGQLPLLVAVDGELTLDGVRFSAGVLFQGFRFHDARTGLHIGSRCCSFWVMDDGD